MESEKKQQDKLNKRLSRISKILGRNKQLPSKLEKSQVLSCGISDPEEILKKSGYINIHRGWIRKIDKNSRNHAYIYKDEFNYNYIYLHKDLINNGKHLAVTDLEEKIRLKQLVIPRKGRKKNDVWLSPHDMKEALKLLNK